MVVHLVAISQAVSVRTQPTTKPPRHPRQILCPDAPTDNSASRNPLTFNALEKWQPRLDSNQEILNQNQVCYQLHYGAVALRRGVITVNFGEDQS